MIRRKKEDLTFGGQVWSFNLSHSAILECLTSDVLFYNIKHHENDIGFGESRFRGVEIVEEQGGRISWKLGFAPFSRGVVGEAG
jgi:hypothetical protein